MLINQRILPRVFMLMGVLIAKCQSLPEGEGVWAKWGVWSNCTRTCGGGMAYQERVCLSGDCTGPDKQYTSCCIETCPTDTLDFKAMQCAEYNEGLLGTDQEFDWVPLDYNGFSQCSQLSCQAVDHPSRILVVPWVVPGTPCHTMKGEAGVCLGRTCTRIGCDGVAGSDKTLDACLQCGGTEANSGNCRRITGELSYSEGNRSSITVPSAATTITVRLAVQSGSASLVATSSVHSTRFDGAASEGSYVIAGTTFHYAFQLQDSLLSLKTLTSAGGPLKDLITFEVCGWDSSTVLMYEYHVLDSVTSSSTVPSGNGSEAPAVSQHMEVHSLEDNEEVDYEWMYSAFSTCSVSCGTGIEVSHPRCHDTGYPDRDPPDAYCEQTDTPRPLPKLRVCVQSLCPARWVAEEWSVCSAECGGGQQERGMRCQQIDREERDRVVADEQCKPELKPLRSRKCSQRPCGTEWRAMPWTECSEKCGEGKKEREFVCVDLSGAEVDREYCCHLPKPATSESCNEMACCHWMTSRWRQCNNTCGVGYQTRRMRCRTARGTRAPKECCADLEVPSTLQPCRGLRRCNINWTPEPWGECVASCDGSLGLQSREVGCTAVVNGAEEVVSEENCRQREAVEPATTQACDKKDCPREWVAGLFGECSTTCDSGLHYRNVTCIQNGRPSTGCLEGTRPSDVGVCEDLPPCSAPGGDVCNNNCRDNSGINCGTIVAAGLCHNNDYYRQVCCHSCLCG